MLDVLLGLEVTNLSNDGEGSPYRMTVDAWDLDRRTIVRYEVVGKYNGWLDGPPERTLDDLARVEIGDVVDRRDPVQAAELDRLDREAAAKIAPIMVDLFIAQAAVLGWPTDLGADRQQALMQISLGFGEPKPPNPTTT